MTHRESLVAISDDVRPRDPSSSPPPLDLRHYWDTRLDAAPGVEGVGYRRLGCAYNQWMYRVRSEVFRRLLDDWHLIGRAQKILDVGSGTGHYIREWLRSGAARVVGSDFSDTAIRRLRAEFPGVPIRRLDIGASELPEGLGRYDVVSAFDVLFHIVADDAYQRAIRNCFTCCRPGGYFVFSELFLRRRACVPHMVSRTGAEIEEVLRSAGFVVLEHVPMFVLMNYPADAGAFAKFAWSAMVAPAMVSELAGEVLGRALIPLERRLVRRVAESPTTEIMLCRRPARRSRSTHRSVRYSAAGAASAGRPIASPRRHVALLSSAPDSTMASAGANASRPLPTDESPSRELLVSIGIDCDPDRDAYPARMAWRGVETLPRLLEIEDVRWTFNVRADTQVRDYCGSAGFCWERYQPIWNRALMQGSAVAWHLHYFDRHGRQDVSEPNILENINVGAEALDHPDVVHMGWTFQNDFSLQHLAEVGVRVDYSPVPRMQHAGRSGVDAYDWSRFAYRPQYWHGVRMLPAFSSPDPLLRRRFGTERVIMTTTTSPLLFRRLLRDFFKTGADFFISYFHADELAGAVGGWRNHLYSYRNLVTNIRTLREYGERSGYRVRFVTIRDLAEILFDERRTRHA